MISVVVSVTLLGVAAAQDATPVASQEKILASLNAGEASYYFSRMGAVWRARDSSGEVLMEHRVGPHFLTDDGMGVDFTCFHVITTPTPAHPLLPVPCVSRPPCRMSRSASMASRTGDSSRRGA